MLDSLTWGPLTAEQVAFLQKYAFRFIIAFGLTMYFCVLGDDDVIYKVITDDGKRKPTGQEGIARIRFVLAKLFTSLYGGCLIGYFLGQVVLKNTFSFVFSQNGATLFAVFCIFIACMLIGVIQNIIRYIQGRQQRPLIDMVIWRHNLKQRWFPKR